MKTALRILSSLAADALVTGAHRHALQLIASVLSLGVLCLFVVLPVVVLLGDSLCAPV